MKTVKVLIKSTPCN